MVQYPKESMEDSYLLEGLDIVHRDEMAVQVHELDPDLLERTLCQQVTLDARQGLVRVVVRLLDETQLLTASDVWVRV